MGDVIDFSSDSDVDPNHLSDDEYFPPGVANRRRQPRAANRRQPGGTNRQQPRVGDRRTRVHRVHNPPRGVYASECKHQKMPILTPMKHRSQKRTRLFKPCPLGTLHRALQWSQLSTLLK